MREHIRYILPYRVLYVTCLPKWLPVFTQLMPSSSHAQESWNVTECDYSSTDYTKKNDASSEYHYCTMYSGRENNVIGGRAPYKRYVCRYIGLQWVASDFGTLPVRRLSVYIWAISQFAIFGSLYFVQYSCSTYQLLLACMYKY